MATANAAGAAPPPAHAPLQGTPDPSNPPLPLPLPPPPPPPLPRLGTSAGATAVPPAAAVAPPEDDDHSDYSSVGDYSDDHDFYDPIDASLLHVDDAGHSADEHQLTPGRELSDEYEFDDDDNDAAAAGPHEEPVRQNSNFSRLSAQSWLTVDSAEDVELGGPGQTEEMLVSSSRNPPSPPPMPEDAADGGEPDEDAYSPLADPRPDAHRLLEIVRARRLTTKSIFECSVELLAGMPAYKKKSFRRFGARRVWLSADCAHLCWTSKKDGFDSDSIKLQLVAKLKCVEREVAIDVVEGYRISLLFSSPEEAGLWARCLSCLIPLQAKVRAPAVYLLKEKEREDYSLEDDSFNGVLLRDHFSVNSYAVIGPVKGHSGEARLAFSRSEKKFVAVRYVPRRITPLLLRSFEEIAVLKRLSHPNIVRYTECLLYQNRGGSFVVFEHQSRGVVMDSSRLEGVSPVQERAARELIQNVISGLEYLHSLQIAHADVRPDNLLRSVNGAVKLNPLGCITHEFTEVRSMSALVRARLAGASPAFLAPELCWRGNAPKLPPKSYAMDVWAVGAVLYFMLYGRVPFGGKDDTSIQENICEGKLRFPRQPETSRKVRNLLKGVLGEKDPRTRIPLSELKMHPWFLESVPRSSSGTPGATQAFGMQPLVVSPDEVDTAVQIAKVRIPA